MDIKEFEKRIKEIKKIIREIIKLARILKAKRVKVRVSLSFNSVNFFIIIKETDVVLKQGLVIDIDFDKKTMIFKAHGLKYSYFKEFDYNPEKILIIGEKYGKKFENDDGEKIKVG